MENQEDVGEKRLAPRKEERKITAYLRALGFPCGKAPGNEAEGKAGGPVKRERVSKHAGV